eukprot:scaffold42532_cov35-Attheya_sp.AAC.1
MEGRRINEFLLGVARIVNNSILGMVESLSQWKVPMNDASKLQIEIGIICMDWMNLHGKDGITNYIHLMSASHMSDYMYEWWNLLYKHSQQGWEALNNLIKLFWFRRTGRGGATGRGEGKKSKLASVAKWIKQEEKEQAQEAATAPPPPLRLVGRNI